MNMTHYSKAWAAVICAIAAYYGLEVGEELVSQVAVVLSPFLVYLIPNAAKK